MQKTEVLQDAAKETMENDFPVENVPVEDWNNT
jgi:hypothetical protein